jgi:hypothetical protein
MKLLHLGKGWLIKVISHTERIGDGKQGYSAEVEAVVFIYPAMRHIASL